MLSFINKKRLYILCWTVTGVLVSSGSFWLIGQMTNKTYIIVTSFITIILISNILAKVYLLMFLSE